MKILNRGSSSRTIGSIHPARIALLSILFICAATACSANGRNAAPVLSQPAAVTASPRAAPTQIQINPTAAVASPSASSPSRSPNTPAQNTAPAAWKTYTDAALHVMLNYPADWQIKQDASGVTFSSSQRATIKLLQVQTGDQSLQVYLNRADLPNTRCSQSTNPQGVKARVCLDTIAFSTTADFIAGTGEHSILVALVMGKRGDQTVFDAMLQSLKVIP